MRARARLYWSVISLLVTARVVMGSGAGMDEPFPSQALSARTRTAGCEVNETHERPLNPTESPPMLHVIHTESMKIPKKSRTLKASKLPARRRSSREKPDKSSGEESSYSSSPEPVDSRICQAKSDPVRLRSALSVSDGGLRNGEAPLVANGSAPTPRRSRADSTEGRRRVKPIDLRHSVDSDTPPKSPRRFIQISPRPSSTPSMSSPPRPTSSSTTPPMTGTSSRSSPSCSPPEVTRSRRTSHGSNLTERLDILVRRKSLNEKRGAVEPKEKGKGKRKPEGFRKWRSSSASARLGSSHSSSEASESSSLEQVVEAVSQEDSPPKLRHTSSSSPPELRRKKSFTDAMAARFSPPRPRLFHRRRSSSGSEGSLPDDSPMRSSSSSGSGADEGQVMSIVVSSSIWATPAESGAVMFPLHGGPRGHFVAEMLRLLGPGAVEEALFAQGTPLDLEEDGNDFIAKVCSGEYDVDVDASVALPILIKAAFLAPLTNTIIDTYLGVFFGPDELLRALILLVCVDVHRQLHPAMALRDLYDLTNPLTQLHFRALVPEYEEGRTPLASIFYQCYKRWLPRAFRDRVARNKGNLERALFSGKAGQAETTTRWSWSPAFH